MRWLTFILTSSGVLIAQLTLAPHFEWGGVRPDWLLVFVVFFSLRADLVAAIAGGWLLGFCADLLTIERLGLLSLSYGLTAFVVASGRDFVFASSAITQTAATLLAGLSLHTAWFIYRRMLYDMPEAMFREMATVVFPAALYTAAWALVLHRPLRGLTRWLGFASSRRRMSRMNRTGKVHV